MNRDILAYCLIITIIAICCFAIYDQNKSCVSAGGELVRGIIGFVCINHE